MGATTKTTSNAATPVANDFQGWLQQQLGFGGGQQKNPFTDIYNGINSNHDLPVGVRQRELANIDRQSAAWNQSHPTSGLPNTSGGGSSFQNAFQNMLNGQVNDPSGANNAIKNSIGGGANTWGQNNTNQYQNQQYIDPTISQLGTNLLPGTGQADLSKYGTADQSKFNTQQGYGDTAQSGYSDVLSSLLGKGQGMMQNSPIPGASAGMASISPDIALDPATKFDMNNDYFKAIQQVGDRNLQNSVANERARFGAQGAGAIGTGAAFAEGNLQAAAVPQQIIAMQQALQGLQSQDLNERSTKANVGLGSRGQDAQVALGNAGNQTQASIASMQGALQGQGQNNSLLQSLLSSTLAGRGQDFQNQQTTNAQNIDRLGLGSQQSMFNAGQNNDMQKSMIQAMLQNQNQGNNFTTNAATLNSQNQQQNNANSMNTANNHNGFNLNNAGNSAQYGQAANALNSNNYQNNQQNWLNTLGLGQGANNASNNAQQSAIQQLMAMFGQSTGLGTAQAQSYQQTNPLISLLGQGLPFLGQALGNGLNGTGGGGMMAGNGQGNSVLNAPLPPINWNPQVTPNSGISGLLAGTGGGGAMYGSGPGTPQLQNYGSPPVLRTGF